MPIWLTISELMGSSNMSNSSPVNMPCGQFHPNESWRCLVNIYGSSKRSKTPRGKHERHNS